MVIPNWFGDFIQAIEVAQNRVECLGVVGRRRRHPRLDVAGLGLRQHRPFVDAGPVVGNPVD